MDSCFWSYSVANIKSVQYEECKIRDILRDYEGYKEHLEDLINSGEAYSSVMIPSYPRELERSSRVFCSRGCSATHYFEGQCFIWESDQRRRFQELYRKALREQEEKLGCYAYQERLTKAIIRKGIFRDYDWKNQNKTKNYDKRSWKESGEGELWKNL